MSGLRPDATAIYNFKNDIREPGQVCVCVCNQPSHSATPCGLRARFACVNEGTIVSCCPQRPV